MIRSHAPFRTGPSALLAQAVAEPVQSVLDPAGPAAHAIERLWWVLFWVCAAVFVIVMVLTALALIRRRDSDNQDGDSNDNDEHSDDNNARHPRAPEPPPSPLGTRFIVVSGVVLPTVVLVGLLFASVRTTIALREEPPALTVRVIGHQWWWEVHYPELGITTANQIEIPAGRPVRLEFASADVIHSFWVPRLHGKMDLTPGVPTSYTIRADRPGTYRGQCAEYCGTQHALMALYVVAMEPAAFDAWAAARATPPAPPADDGAPGPGLAVFMAQGCGNCHAIRGTPANGRVGPDLTHMGSRLSIGAATMPNTRGHMGGWISNPQPLKPGNKMPATPMAPDDLQVLVDYLESLQ